MSLTLNGTAGSVSIETGSSIWLNGILTTGDAGAVLTLYVDGAKQSNGTSVSTSYTFSTAGTYSVSLNYTTTQNYSNSIISYTVTVADAATSSSSGGGGPAPVKTVPDPTVTHIIDAVSVEKGIDISITNTDIPVSSIEVDMREGASNVEIKVTASDERPASVPESPKTPAGSARSVYKYLEISHKNIAGKIERARIRFKVPKSWLADNGYDKNQIILQRYNGATWEELVTEFVEETDNNVYYSAETKVFSVFVIVVKVPETPVETAPVEQPEKPATVLKAAPPPSEGETEETLAEEPPEDAGGIPWGMVLGILVVVLVSGTFVVMRLKHAEEGPERAPLQPPAGAPQFPRAPQRGEQVAFFGQQPQQPVPPVVLQQPIQEVPQQPPVQQERPIEEADNPSKIVAYIQECRSLGHPDDIIRDQLIKVGYGPDQVDEGFKALSSL